MNVILKNPGIDAAVNIFDCSMDVCHGDMANTGKIVINLNLAHEHVEVIP